jgi:hypothetical protein
MKVRALTVAVFRSIASCSSESSRSSHVIAEVSIDSSEGDLVERSKLDQAVTLLMRSRLVEANGDDLRLTPEGDQFWRRISHLPRSGIKKWISEAVAAYSRGEDLEWATSEEAWSDAHVLFRAAQRTRMTARLEILDGLVAAVENLHLVSTLVGGAADRSAAIAALEGFPLHLTRAQAQYVVDMRLSQRTALARLSLTEERDAIRAELGGATVDESPGGGEHSSGAWDARLQGVQSKSRVAG